ncbi:MAG TPA: PEP-utilizing enzyme [Acidimicrobiia bacterium]|nr:PEP-utilizing enzyme [Acidimicrobiia bacterium]
MDTGTLPETIPVPIEVPAGYWRRERTHCPKPVSPFFRGGLALVTQTFGHAFSELGALADTLEYREIGGWVYSRMVPPGGEEDLRPSPELLRERTERALDTVRSDRYVDYIDRWPEWRSEYIAGVARLREVDLGSLDDQGLAEHLGEIFGFSIGAWNFHFLFHGIGALMLADLAFTCRDLLGWDDAQALALLAGLSKASSEPADVLAGLTAMAADRPAVRRFIESGQDDLSQLWDIDPEFAACFGDYQEEFGFRSIRYEVADPSMLETPDRTLRLIADQLQSGYDPAARVAAVTERREAVRADARALLAGRPEADRARFERALDRAQRWYPAREDYAPMTFSEQVALIRRVALDMGRRLAESSLIDDPDDVFWLEGEEAGAALAGRAAGTTSDYRELVRRRQAERVWVEAHPGPDAYGEPHPLPGLDELPPEARFVTEALIWLFERAGHYVKSPRLQPGGPCLTGIPASDGTYTGPARVLLDEADFGKLQPGDVLVCPITSPAWSVLFPNVKALVADVGSVLSHSAIIAREFAIPAVVATGNATSLIRDGQLVTVDGSTGSVEVLA